MENVPPEVDSHGKRRDNNQKDAALLDKDKGCEQTLSQTDRELRSLLELGQIISLDLQIDDMLVQIAKKATKVMETDRFTIFLYDPNTDELWSKASTGRLTVSFSYNQEHTDKVKTIPDQGWYIRTSSVMNELAVMLKKTNGSEKN